MDQKLDLILGQPSPAHSDMTMKEFTIQIEALIIKAQAAGISVEQEVAVLKGIIDG